jgi:hypothetical protein
MVGNGACANGAGTSAGLLWALQSISLLHHRPFD